MAKCVSPHVSLTSVLGTPILIAAREREISSRVEEGLGAKLIGVFFDHSSSQFRNELLSFIIITEEAV